MPNDYCSQDGECGNTEEHKKNAQSDYNFKPECMKGCNVTKDGNCGLNFDKTSCPVPGLRCTSTSICSTYDQERDQVDYEFRPECPEECNQTFDNKCGKV